MKNNRKNEIIYFDERSRGNDFLHLAMAGKTLPNPNYLIVHSSKAGTVWERYNFEYVVSGKGYIETKEKTIPVRAGDLYFLNKLQQHTYYADRDDPFEKLFLVVEGSLVDSILSAHGITESAAVVHADARAIFEQAFALANKHAGEFFDAESYTELSCCILRLAQLIAPPQFNERERKENPAVVAKNFIDYNVYERIDLSEIASAVHLSVSQTERVFRAMYGVPPMRYALDKKLNVAKHLFMTTFLNVSEVAERLSFTNVKYFSRQFKAAFGQSPSSYMKAQADHPFPQRSRD